MNVDELKKEVAKIRWYHTIDLGHGVVTPGLVDSPALLKQFRPLPDNLQGKTVLDIGAWDGFYSFEAERRGAKRVLAIDSLAWGVSKQPDPSPRWRADGWGSKVGFELARKALNSKVEEMEMEVLDLSPERIGKFDVVLFLGVLYHMCHPLLAVERVASVTSEQLILETHVDLLRQRRPAMAFYPGTELNNDWTNWWGPNPAAIEAMLKTVGFQKVTMVPKHSLGSRHSFAYRAARTMYRVIKNPKRFFLGREQDRMVFHAWR